MNHVLAEVSALPLFGQITVQDVGTSDLPDWETGEERVVATKHAVAVATRSDADGDVTIRVIEGEEVGELGQLVFEGALSLTSPLLEVGNFVAATVAQVKVGRIGPTHLRIFVEPIDLPTQVNVLIDPLN
ncbi:MAG: hypothetical protein JWP85_2226 [Rhodoglobus sp.]|nr:hypothetical protein [Rhodoglobus sp.]